RHTRFSRDWSSDVCSSDLARVSPGAASAVRQPADRRRCRGFRSARHALPRNEGARLARTLSAGQARPCSVLVPSGVLATRTLGLRETPRWPALRWFGQRPTGGLAQYL